MKIPPLHILLLGEPFAGKSTFTRTMPVPNLVFFFDPYGKDQAYLECGTVQEADDQGNPLMTREGCPIKRVWRGDQLLFQLEYYHDGDWQFTNGALAPVPKAYENFCRRLVDVDQEFDRWNTISLDSYSGAQLAALLRQKYKINPGNKYDLRHWAGGAKSEMEMIVFSRFGSFPMNVVVIMHEGFYEDKQGTVYRAPHTYGALGYEMPRGFSEMYRMINDPVSRKRYLQTQKDAMWNANSKYAPNPCEPDYQAIIASLTNETR